jgi:mannose-6-phosphate isomerase-like protein (cupin superfamily)
MLDESSNWMDWAELVKDIELPQDFEGVHLHTLESNDKRELFLAIVKEEVPEEVHHDLLESFILLKGTCTCQVHKSDGSIREVHMREGDYIGFKLGEHHDILITSSEPAVAILQWLKTA